MNQAPKDILLTCSVSQSCSTCKPLRDRGLLPSHHFKFSSREYWRVLATSFQIFPPAALALSSHSLHCRSLMSHTQGKTHSLLIHNEIHLRDPLPLVRTAIIRISSRINGCRENEILLHSEWGGTGCSHNGKQHGSFLKK